MKDISAVDKNFKIETKIEKSDIKFYSVRTEPFKVYGVFYEDGKFRRLPEAVAKTVSAGVYELHAHAAGGRVRFRTDSPYVAISAKMSNIYKMAHFAFCGSAGFDLYADGAFVRSYMPSVDIVDGYESVLEVGCASVMREITVNFPLYSEVTDLYIGLAESARVEAPTPYRIETPIVYYGSSVTQGGCASRPGNSYQGFVSRALDANHINLGFSGNARGEPEIAEYIKGLDMSAFVLDYDYNAPTLEHLAATHEPMFLKIREAYPDLPVLMMSRPRYNLSEEEVRVKVVRRTYENALARGDKDVYYLGAKQLLALAGNDGTVDSTHPTDFGFYSMAQAIIPVFKKVFGIE